MKKSKKIAYGCMDDCIHLHACRRVQAIGKSHRLLVPRYCTEDCVCYLSADTETDYVSIDDAVSYARSGVSSVQSGYTDVYASFDLSGLTLGKILEELMED